MFYSKLVRFEYWPYLLFYFPMFFYGLFLAFRSRAIMYFSTANPCMKYGGVMGESKSRLLSRIDPEFLPDTLLVVPERCTESLLDEMEARGLGFPVIAKPDVGERGRFVELIEGPEEMARYHRYMREAFIVQEYVRLPVELGILYYRFPGDDRGHVSSVTRKGFLSVTGDGTSTLGSLIRMQTRAAFRLDYLKKKFSDAWSRTLADGEQMLLEPIGNHNRGTAFYNGNALISPRLETVMDHIAQGIEDFYYGRFDIRTSSEVDLCMGKNIKVLELNGVSSEPAHIYDPSNSLWRAYRDVMAHMRIIRAIADENYRRGHPRASLKPFVKDVWRHFRRNRLRKARQR